MLDLSSTKKKWGLSPRHGRAQHDEACLHTQSKTSVEQLERFQSSTCLSGLMDHIYSDHSMNTEATLHRACFFGWGNLAWFKVHWSQWRDSAPSTGLRWCEARTGNWGNIRATLFVALNICLVFWNLLTKAAWKKLGSQRLFQVVLFWLYQNSWNKPKTPARLLCSCHSLLQLTLSNRWGLPQTGRSAAVLASKVIVC